MKLKIAAAGGVLFLAFLSVLPAFQEGPVEDEAYSLDRALFSLNIIRDCLSSFQKLTADAEGKIPQAEWAKIGNTDWEMQNLGFSNHPGIVEGALLRQDVEIKRLEWHLARLRAESGRAGEAEVETALKAFEASKKAFEDFKATFRLKD